MLYCSTRVGYKVIPYVVLIPGVTVVASTDKPWLLDSTLIKYLEKRIYIPMPDTQRRSRLFQIHLRCLSNKTPPIIPNVLTGHDYRYVALCFDIMFSSSDTCFEIRGFY